MSKDTKERVRRIIRDATVLNPLISLRELQKILLKKNVPINNLNSLSNLRKEITKELLSEADPRLVRESLYKIRERNRIVTEKLWPIVLWNGTHGDPSVPPPTYADQIKAANTIIKLDLSLFKIEMEFGVFEKGPMTKEEELWMRNRPLPQEYRDSIAKAMKNWGFDADSITRIEGETGK